MEKEEVLSLVWAMFLKCTSNEVPFCLNYWRNELSIYPNEERNYIECVNIVLNNGPRGENSPNSLMVNVPKVGYMIVDLTDEETIEVKRYLDSVVKVSNVNTVEAIKTIAKL